MRLATAFACVIFLSWLGILPGHAEKRVALVIGNSAYQSAPPLPNTKNDAADMAAALKAVGFDTKNDAREGGGKAHETLDSPKLFAEA